MKKSLLFICAVFSAFALCGAKLDGTWFLNAWSGYKPLPKTVKGKDGSFSVTGVTAKYGTGILSNVRVPAKAGETMKFTALVKGKGKMFFRLQDFDAKNRWLRVAPACAYVDLTSDWKEVTLSVKVENDKSRVTAFCVAFIGVGKGGELAVKNASMEIEAGDYVGDYVFPRHWNVFAPVDASVKAPLNNIPGAIGKVRAKNVTLDNGMLQMAPFFPKQKLRNTAWLYGTINAPVAGKYTIGAGADYFMAIYVNGKCVLDTLKSGNQAEPVHFSNHKTVADLKKGKNIIAVKFQAGASQRPVISLGGANELRNLSSILTVEERFVRDDYEKPGKRSGNPKLITGILTDGIEEKTGQGVYTKGSVIKFDRTYNMPPKLGGKLFAFGLRLHKFNGAGNITYTIGKNTKLVVGRSNAKSNFTMTVFYNNKKLKSAVLPVSALPSDIIFAFDANEYYVNAMSLQDSKLRAVNGRAVFAEKAPFTAEIKVNAPSVTVDEFFAGLAKREVKSNTVPFKVALDSTFDPVKAGWRLAWADEFNGKEVDWKNNWMNSPWAPEPRNREMAYLKDGKLHIKAVFTPDPKNPGKFKGRTVGLYSQKRFSYGYYEAKVRFTKKPGWWAAFWMLDEGRNMAAGGGYEIDIFEDYSTRSGKNVVANNLHVNFGPGNRSYGYHFTVPGSLDDFYIVGCKWTPFEVSVYINGKLVRSSSRHSPYQSVTYDAVNHGFCTTTLYLCLSGQCGSSGGRAGSAGNEEFVVDYVRAYAYPHQFDPEITVTEKPSKSNFKPGEKIIFKAVAKPSKKTKSKIRTLYLFDNGNLIDYKEGSSAKFEFAVDEKHYKDTIWAGAGRGLRKSVFDAYPHFFVIAAQDEKGNVVTSPLFPVIVDMGKSTPYKGKIAVVPGKIDTAKFDDGGNGNASYKQKRRGGTFPVGQDKLFSRRKLNLRECGEWANFTFKAEKAGKYDISLNRDKYRLYYPIRAMVLIDGVYAGDLKADKFVKTATLKGVKLTKGTHRLTLMSACTYGIWPLSLEFAISK